MGVWAGETSVANLAPSVGRCGVCVCVCVSFFCTPLVTTGGTASCIRHYVRTVYNKTCLILAKLWMFKLCVL